MKYPEAAPYVTKVGFGAQYAAALIINKDVYDKLPPALQKILREAGEAWARGRRQGPAGRSATKATTSVPRLHRRQHFELPREEQAKWADAMPNIAKEWAERIDKQGLPGTKALAA